jgi:hypothetical protein
MNRRALSLIYDKRCNLDISHGALFAGISMGMNLACSLFSFPVGDLSSHMSLFLNELLEPRHFPRDGGAIVLGKLRPLPENFEQFSFVLLLMQECVKTTKTGPDVLQVRADVLAKLLNISVHGRSVAQARMTTRRLAPTLKRLAVVDQ